MSSERGGQGIGPSLPIQLPGNVLSRNADFFLWGCLKNSVFQTPVNGLDLKTLIRNAISAIPADMLHRTWQELEYRLGVLRAANEAHIEVLSSGVKRPRREANHSPPTCAEVKKMWIYTSTPHNFT
ncbi:hypothetical protein B7P43_G01024 [Cryptotermes secundus]|uniref:Uncharacterized protein n=1 Tax=Cryptotermes secundus TaxID=105785 RepID=A0A2J7PFY3_9NEOP|nr:hypothetical protein B7P43_G01024 [Cryptotermes secundus]